MCNKENSISSESEYSKDKLAENDFTSVDNNYTTSENPPLRSTISFSSSSSKITAAPMNHRHKVVSNINQQLEVENKASQSADRAMNSCLSSRTSTMKKLPLQQTQNSTNTGAIRDFDRIEQKTNTQVSSNSLSREKNRIMNRQSFTQAPAQNTLSKGNPSTSLVDANATTMSKLSGSSIIESTLEYRELKRLYLHEKKQAEEWKKDYMILKRQLQELRSSTLPRPTAEVLEWLRELFDLLNSNAAFRGDGKSLSSVGEELGIDETARITVAARTPQKSALKIFRLLYPTISLRANCISILKLPEEQLQNIYLYVRLLHPNLTFKMIDMRRAIGNSIRSATHEMRKLEYQRQEQLNQLQNDEDLDPDERNERMQDVIDTMDMALNANDATLYDCDPDGDENGEDDDDIEHLTMTEELDEDDDEL
ncbi:unnamed protein product [Rotaria sordida]|uniref:Uncharacterized protein n=1 Tax=Rotaria sordida TaxID=392033 RepID=A0A815J053_9BILA|nr:unnamed protein product [Rotaria sordida]CAF1375822.1 unnamed protein product [Rotaria sordida]CAF3795932.1 unnamed protein product [Rotaria sordida]CAF3871900.1 unnamed protein product [Rotaria sordida]